jgi:hypothetical protein
MFVWYSSSAAGAEDGQHGAVEEAEAADRLRHRLALFQRLQRRRHVALLGGVALGLDHRVQGAAGRLAGLQAQVYGVEEGDLVARREVLALPGLDRGGVSHERGK